MLPSTQFSEMLLKEVNQDTDNFSSSCNRYIIENGAGQNYKEIV